MSSGMLFENMDGDKRAAFADRLDTGKDEWLTPPEIIKAVGSFDLDPCAPIKRPWEMAAKHLTPYEDGLKTDWGGCQTRIWLNPPYGTFTAKWMQKMAMHNNGIALIYCRTETASFFPWVWNHATGIFFFSHRLFFYHVSGKKATKPAGAPSCLVAYNDDNANALWLAGADKRIKGSFVDLRRRKT